MSCSGQEVAASEHQGLQLLDRNDGGDVTSMLANARREAAYFRGRAGLAPTAPLNRPERLHASEHRVLCNGCSAGHGAPPACH